MKRHLEEEVFRMLEGGEDDERATQDVEAAILEAPNSDLAFAAAASSVVSEAFLGALHERSSDPNVQNRITANHRAPLALLGRARYNESEGRAWKSFATRKGRPELFRRFHDYNGDPTATVAEVWEGIVRDA